MGPPGWQVKRSQLQVKEVSRVKVLSRKVLTRDIRCVNTSCFNFKYNYEPYPIVTTGEVLISQLNLTITSPMLAGRLAQFVSNWEKAQDRWVLQAIRGYKLELVQPPWQIKPMPAIRCSLEEVEMISTEVRELLAKGAVIETPPAQEGFVSQIFLVEKKEGGQRPVINLKALNTFVKHEHFKMEGLHFLPDLIQSEDWMIKLDLKDAYLQVPIHTEHQPPSIPMGRQELPISMSPIRTDICPTGFLQNNETCGGSTSTHGDSSSHLPRRYPSNASSNGATDTADASYLRLWVWWSIKRNLCCPLSRPWSSWASNWIQ